MAYVVVALVAFLASGLTMVSGFGLGTLLMPVFALFVPVELAVAASALVHGANNILKAVLLGRLAERSVVLRFGVPAIFAAIFGALALGALSHLDPLATYSLGARTAAVTPVKIAMAVLMAGFALFDVHPHLAALQFDRAYLPLGALLSGFFGGLSGHQGALRSAFLARTGLTPEAFVGTNAVIGLLVDLSRLSVYAALVGGGTLNALARPRELWLVGVGATAAFLGVLVAKPLLRKVTMRSVQRVTAGMLFLIALALGLV